MTIDASLAELNQVLLKAHEEGDQEKLASLYQMLAQRLEAQGDSNAACFFMTHAYVFGLAAGSPDAASTWEFLRDHGRESGSFIPP
jgi:hypothetical protein